MVYAEPDCHGLGKLIVQVFLQRMLSTAPAISAGFVSCVSLNPGVSDLTGRVSGVSTRMSFSSKDGFK